MAARLEMIEATNGIKGVDMLVQRISAHEHAMQDVKISTPLKGEVVVTESRVNQANQTRKSPGFPPCYFFCLTCDPVLIRAPVLA